MIQRRIQQKFVAWRGEPEHVRLRIATYLTGATGGVIALLWLFVLLPLQLALTHPSKATAPSTGEVAGAVTSATPTPTPSASPNGY